jgi:DNA-binding response OmpR family regulator/S1-C subfamily serine protease
LDTSPEKILIMDGDESSRHALQDLLRNAGYDATTADVCDVGLAAARNNKIDLLLLDASLPSLACGDVLLEMKGASATAGIRVIVLDKGGASERARALDLGADDVLSRPWDSIEMLARVRRQLRAKKAQDELRERTVIAEQGQELSRTAFHALAVTEKMKRDAYTIGRGMKIGLAALFAIAAVMALFYFSFSRRANKEEQGSYAAIARLNRGLVHQEDLIAQARRASEQTAGMVADSGQASKQRLEKKSQQLRAQLAQSPAADAGNLRGQLDKTEARLRLVESEGSLAQGIIRSYAESVCLIHVAVAFRDKASQRRLRYTGLNPDGGPMIDDEGNPELTLDGLGPDVMVHALGTGFLVSANGRILTNHHVAEPWWNNDELSSALQEGLEPVIDRMEAYFPSSPRTFPASVDKISSEADLATLRVSLGDLKRAVLTIDAAPQGSVSGEPVVLMGYPTGIDAVLARADDSTVRDIVKASHGDLNQVLAALAKSNLIHPVVTQGHLGDVLPDKFIYDAQTTSGGSGGPLFNPQGKVIAINYAVIRDFGGSNFGIPGHFAQALLAH